MSGIKLTYFDGRGRGEISRLLLTAAGQKFEDVRITFDQWPALKAKSKFNVLPNLQYNGKTYGQSMAIAQFLAREFGMYGKDNEEALRVDEAVHILTDVRTTMMKIMFEKDAAKKEELVTGAKESIPKALKFLDELAVANGKKGFIAGSKLSIADLLLLDSLDTAKKVIPEISLNGLPELQKVMRSVEATPSIKSYLAKRPVTDM
ncbi:glutathione S-transferase-like [Littorina saxatilis]|uniref:Uncharacterized protein n=1 Tax=Littorina saxatilis TaxID=31220 RepID=A0AAN9AW10_9CAEN